MNTDKELLELAAKAAGIKWHKAYLAYLDGDGFVWNPLVRDDHALRLAVKLGIEPRQADNMASALFPVESPTCFAVCNENHGDDPYAATRRAIVRAAAEIGRGMG